MSGGYRSNRENPGEAPGPIDRALDRDRDDRMDLREGNTGERVVETGNEVRIPVAEERLNVEKREGQIGEVELRRTVTEEQQSIPVELHREEVHVEQRDVPDQPVQAGEEIFQEGTIRVPVRGEEAVVSKEAVVTGEVVVNKAQTTERQTVADTVRRERVEVDENYNQYRQGFQQHYAGRQGQLRGTQYGQRSFEEAEPNYQYGYMAGRSGQYGNRPFEEVEPDLRRDYESRYANQGSGDAWQQLREEIREGYNRVRG